MGEFYYWTKEEIDYLIKYYPIASWEEILKNLPNRSRGSIKTKAYDLKIKMINFWTKEDDKLLKKMFPTATYKELLRAFPGRTKKAIVQRMAKINKTINSLKIKRKRKNWDLDLFDIKTPWSDEKAWVLGLIWSDGCLSAKNNISLSSIDLELSKHFKKVLNIKEKIKVIPPCNKKINNRICKIRTLYVINFSSIKMSNDLRRLGCHHNKSHTIDYPKELPDEHFWSFFRGLMDGDGCVTINKNNCLGVGLCTASKKLKDSLCLKFNELNIKHSIYKNISVYEMNFSSRDYKHIYSRMYPNNNIPYLSRKKDKFELGIKLKEEKLFKNKKNRLYRKLEKLLEIN